VAVAILAATVLRAGEARARTPMMHGDPVAGLRFAQEQAAPGECGPVAVAMVLSAFRGELVPSMVVRWEVRRLGLGVGAKGGGPRGTTTAVLAGLLRHHGIDAQDGHATVNGLRRDLDAGRIAILQVESDVLWFGEDRWAGAWGSDADHFVVATAIDDGAGVAYLNDPGHGPAYGFPAGSGAGMAVPLERLVRAWVDAGGGMVVTEQVTRAGLSAD